MSAEDETRRWARQYEINASIFRTIAVILERIMPELTPEQIATLRKLQGEAS